MGTLNGALLPPRGTDFWRPRWGHTGLEPGGLGPSLQLLGGWGASLSLPWSSPQDDVNLISVHLLSQQGVGGPEPRRPSQVPGPCAESQGLRLLCPE